MPIRLGMRVILDHQGDTNISEEGFDVNSSIHKTIT